MTLKVTRDHFGRRLVFDQAEPEPDSSGTLFKAVTALFEKADPATRREILETLTDMAELPQQAEAIGEDARRRRARDTRARRLGQDAAPSAGFARRYPSAARISVLPSESDFANVRR